MGRLNIPAGMRNRATQPGMGRRWYAYTGTSTGKVITASQSTVDSFTVNDDADFNCLYITYKATSDSVLLQIVLTKTNLMNRAHYLPNIAGTGQEANIIPFKTPLFFGRKETVNLELTDFSGSSNTVFISFIGYEFDARRG